MSWDTGANDSGFTPDAGFEPDTSGGFTADVSGGFDNGGFGGDTGFNDGDHGGDADDRTCRICDKPGHLARECPNKPAMECYNCGQTGHSKADCTNERVERPFTGTCRLCNVEGHRASECPDKPPESCRLCQKEGHKAMECTAKRTDMFRDAPDMTDGQAWTAMKQADKAKDMDDLRNAFQAYCKYLHSKTEEGVDISPVKANELETAFRAENFRVHLIAKEKEVQDIYTIVSPSGVIGQKYLLTFQWSDKPKSHRHSAGWPKDAEENLTRLESAGFQIDCGIPKCSNCGKLGHVNKSCPEEKAENSHEMPKITCYYCGAEGHRARNCDNKPQDLCRNCKQLGHKATDCTNPRDTSDVECKACGETGHFARDCPSKPAQVSRTCRNCGEEGHIGKDCPNPANPALMVCRNCDEKGHMSRECPKPTDWSRVRCKECGELGHTVKRCPQANAQPSGVDGGFGNDGFNSTDAPVEAASGGWANTDDAGGVAVEASGGW